MKFKNQKSLVSILIVLLLISVLTAVIDIPIDEGEFIIPPEVDETTAKSLEQINLFVQKNLFLVDGKMGSINIDDSGNVNLLDVNGGEFAKFPKEMVVVFQNNELTFSWGSSKLLGPIEINGFKAAQINSLTPTKVKYSKKDGVRIIEVFEGTAVINAGSVESSSKVEIVKLWNGLGYNFVGIENAIIKLDENNEIEFADFESTYGGEFDFDYKGKRYNFKTKDPIEGGKKARVLFDPLNNKISGENTEINYDSSNENENRFSIDGNFQLDLDDDGDLKSIKIDEGVYKSDELFDEAKTEFSAVNGKPLTIFLNGREIKDFAGNAISIDQENKKIFMKGQIKALGIKERLNYEGLSSDAYTEFYHNGKEGDGVAYLDVQEGEANIDNGKHLVHIKDGIAKIRVKNGAGVVPTSFRFSAANIDGRTEGFVNEDQKSNKYIVQKYDSSGKEKGKLVEVSLSEVKKVFSDLEVNSREFLDNGLERINRAINSQDFSQKEKDSLELSKRLYQNAVGILDEEPLEDSIDRIEDFIDSNPDSEVKAIAQIALGELILEKIARDRPDYGSSYAESIANEAIAEFTESKKIAEDLLLSGDITDESRDRFLLMKEQAELSIGKSLLHTNRPLAERDFRLLAEGGSNTEIQSEANRLFALSRLAQNPAGQVEFALEKLKLAVDQNPNNFIAYQNLKDLQLSLIDSRQSQFLNEGNVYLQDIEGLVGEGFTSLSGATNTISSVFSHGYYVLSGRLDEFPVEMETGLREMDVRLVGSRGMETLIANDVDLSDYMSSDFVGKFQDVMRSHNLETYLTAEDFRSYYDKLELTYSESRYVNDISRLHSVIEKDKGKSVADSFLSDFEKIEKTMGSIDHAIKIDPMLHMIAGYGSEIKDGSNSLYFGDSELLSSAFTLDRAGEQIERTWAEAVGLTAGDLVIGSITVAGIGGTVKFGAQAIGKALNVGARTNAVFGSAGKIFNPVSTLLGSSSKTSIVLGGVGDISVGVGTYGALGTLPTEARAIAGLYDIASIFAPISQTSKKVSKKVSSLLNEAGDARIFIHAVDKDEISYLGTRLGIQGAKRRSDLGNNVYQLNNEIFEVGTEVGSGFKVVNSLDVDPLKTYRLFGKLENPEHGWVEQRGKFRREYGKLRKKDSFVEVNPNNIDSDGRFRTNSGKLLEKGPYIWTVGENKKFRIAKLFDGNSQQNYHSVLVEGKDLPAAGEIYINENGIVVEGSSWTGHYYPGSKLIGEFNEQAEFVFRAQAAKNGLDISGMKFYNRALKSPEVESQYLIIPRQNEIRDTQKKMKKLILETFLQNKK